MTTPESQDRLAGLIASGRDALSRCEWTDARRSFERAVELGDIAEAWEGLAAAAWWLSDEAATFSARERAYRMYRDAGNRPAAARMATWLATDSVEFRGQPAVANGWIQRTRRLLEGLDPTPEHGWLTLWEGHLALMLRNDTATARQKGIEAAGLASEMRLVDLEMLGLALEGLALVSEGHVADGMSRLDEAATAAISGEMEDVNAMSTVLCYLIDACSRARDFDRAAQWCRTVEQFAEAKKFMLVFSVCRPNYALVMMWRGLWDEAEAQLTRATVDLKAARPPMAIEGMVRLAELRTRQGRLGEAEQLFRDLEQEPLSQLGRAELALSRGDAATALDLAERYLRRMPAEDRLERFGGLEMAARALAALRMPERAAVFAAEAQVIAKEVGTLPLQAAASHAAGLVASADGDHEAARRHMEDAIDTSEQGGAPFEAGRARVALAAELRALGRYGDALREASSALRTLESVGASFDVSRAAALVRELESVTRAPGRDTAGPDGLTQREVEVLALIAAGRSNHEIAETLVLSVRTVERHISTIYEKIGASGKVARAVATAYALSHGLS